MTRPLPVAKADDNEICLLPALANRHGLITGATGTGKTVTLQRLAEQFSDIGVPVFMADIKGDLSGLGAAGVKSEKLAKRLDDLKVTDWRPMSNPVVFWDVFGENGHPVRATISDMGPLLLARLLGLNDTQEGVLQLVFKIADDQGLLLLDLKDLRAMIQYVGENAKTFTTEYGNISVASIGAIQRGLLTLEQQGGDNFFGEPMLDIADLMQTDQGKGVINILAADKLMNSPRLYSTFLLWLMAELFEQLPEAGDLDKPKLVFFFDEAHLLFSEAPPALLEKVEQVVRLIRSKGVGIYFVTQNPLDVPDKVLGQLGNRVQHALRAFTPRDQKAVQTAAETLRANPKFDAQKAITELAVGEALLSFLDEKGTPQVVERAFVLAPGSRIGPLNVDERSSIVKNSVLFGHYEELLDRDSAYEKLKGLPPPAQTGAGKGNATTAPASAPPASAPASVGGATANPAPAAPAPAEEESGGMFSGFGSAISNILVGTTGPRGGHHPGVMEAAAKSAARAIGSQVGREIIRGVLGSILGGRR